MATLSKDGDGDWVLDLAGGWTVVLDRAQEGREARWYAREMDGEKMALPGCLGENGFGDPVTVETKWTGSIFDRSWFTKSEYAQYRDPDNLKVPFCLQPLTHYAGIAWYQRTVEIPEGWTGHAVRLFLERPHWATEVWLDETRLGTCDSLSTPHLYNLPERTVPGRHRLTVRIDNSHLLVDIGENSHTITDHTQGNWNGVIGRIELRAGSGSGVEKLDPFPSVEDRRVRVRGQVRGSVERVDLSVEERGTGRIRGQASVGVDENGCFEATLDLGADAPLWDEHAPNLFTLKGQPDVGSASSRTFGLREIATDGRRILLNGRAIFLRATLECAIFPETGYPPTEIEPWRRILRIARAHGLNSLRFHSWCPPEAAFVAADEEGFFYQIEAGSWPNWSCGLGDGEPVDAWVEAETGRILAEFGHHPSFLFMASGNEPGGEHHADWLGSWVNRWRERDPRRLYTTAAAWPIREESDFHLDTLPRIQAWGAGLESSINAEPPETLFDFEKHISQYRAPLISHEIGQWCVYPDFREMARYTGYLKPRNFEIFRERLEASGQLALAEAFVEASGKLQTLCYKADIEAALRTPGMAGFQLLDLHDFPGQGTALVGVLNAFWESKGYTSPEDFRQFCGPVVPLARLAQRVFTANETFTATIEVAHWAAEPAVAVEARWEIRDEAGDVVRDGLFPRADLPVGGPFRLGEINVPLSGLSVPGRFALQVSIPRMDALNSWDIWVYPEVIAKASDEVLLTDQPDEAFRALRAGRRVLLAMGRERFRGDDRGAVQLGFSSIFWNTAWTEGQAPHTLGILCDPQHPAFALFPTESHSNWQWWYPIHEGGAMVLDDLPSALSPIVRVIDDWYRARRLAMLLEARVGAGRLLLCSVDVLNARDPVNRQLLASLLAYAGSDDFRPEVPLDESALAGLFA